MTTKNHLNISKVAAIHELWRRGELSWKLKPHQKDLYQLFYQTNHKVQTWLLARRSGKTFTLALLAIEACLKKPNTIVKFLSPTRLQISSILRPIMREILVDCPEELKPEFRAKDYVYYFANGSEIQLAGSESGNAEKLRGGFSHIAIIDESQDVTDLDNTVKSILLPTTLTTKGKVLLAGTPPKDQDHEFLKFVEEAEMRGSLVRKTVYDNSMLTAEQIEEMKIELGGEKSEAFRRELLCEIVRNSSTIVIPEFTSELEKEIVREWPLPPYFDTYVAMDIGFKDLTVVLFGYYDFRADKIIIQDEIVKKGEDLQLDAFAQEIIRKEAELWTNPLTLEVRTPTNRVSDINYIVTQEISKHSKGQLYFNPVKKDDKEAAVNDFRVKVDARKIIIDPRCKTVIRHIKHAKWDQRKNVNKFARSVDDGHYDALDASIYLIRNVSYGKNPYPPGYKLGLRKDDQYLVNPQNYQQSTTNSGYSSDIFNKIFNVKKRR